MFKQTHDQRRLPPASGSVVAVKRPQPLIVHLKNWVIGGGARALLSRLARPRLWVRVFGSLLFASVAWVLAYGYVIEAPGTLLMTQRAIEGENVRRATMRVEDMSPHIVRAVIAAEDSRFCSHNGFDVSAIRMAFEHNSGGGDVRGASTISQQTAKNLFLWPQRSWLRKVLEAYFTGLIELTWSKERILEAYLNSAEWGDGLFGVGAAAQARFSTSGSELAAWQAARLAAVLPNPHDWRADVPGPYVLSRSATVEARADIVKRDGLATCVLGHY